MTKFSFVTLDVFATARFEGNPLAVVFDADELDTDTMQKLASEFNFSETAFLLRPAHEGHHARVRIFNRRAEMPFAGHPLIGSAVALAVRKKLGNELILEVPAGVVSAIVSLDPQGRPKAATVEAPCPFSTGLTLDARSIARALAIAEDDVLVGGHLPIVASAGNPFVIAELAIDALQRCKPDLAGFRSAIDDWPELSGRLAVYVYARSGAAVSARMFAPLSGTWEDPATGSAAAALAGLFLSTGCEDAAIDFTIRQGAEMGRPSVLRATARRTSLGIVATIEGACIPMTCGTVEI
jgi:trans-2,3-dihydro-3-hydroxyanthranilate isomerase